MQVNSVTTRGIDIRQFHTYEWALSDELSTGDPRLDNNPFFIERLRAAVEEGLAARGFEKASAGQPALTIHYHASVTQRLDLSNADPKYLPADCSPCGPFLYEDGSLVLDFVDARTDKLVWRGWAEGGIDGLVERQDRMEETIDRAVARILERFPGGS
jgi:hypothetical protein